MSASIVLKKKLMKKTLVHSEEIVGMLIQPILWVVLFRVGMGVALRAFKSANE